MFRNDFKCLRLQIRRVLHSKTNTSLPLQQRPLLIKWTSHTRYFFKKLTLRVLIVQRLRLNQETKFSHNINTKIVYTLPWLFFNISSSL